MKSIHLLMLSLLSIPEILCAQQRPTLTATEKIFAFPAYPIRSEFKVNLGKGNRMSLDLPEGMSVNAFSNVDSILQIFLLDITLLKDSFPDPLSTKRIDYVTDLSGSKKIRIRQSVHGGEIFLLKEGVLSHLKIEQDTIIISGPIGEGLYRLTFYLNEASELADYIDGRLNAKMREIASNDKRGAWRPSLNNWYVMRADTAVSVKKTGGAHFRVSSYIGPDLTVNFQNYKNYFIPSFSLGAAVRLNNGLTTHDIGVYWEPQFLFTRDPLKDHVSTYRNDFVTLFYKLGTAAARASTESQFFFRPFLSIGYLYHQEGSYFDNHTFRLGIGKADFLNGKVTLQPVLYFHDFFQGVTPGLKLAVRFL